MDFDIRDTLNRREALYRATRLLALSAGGVALLSGCASNQNSRTGLPPVRWPDEPLASGTRRPAQPGPLRQSWSRPSAPAPDVPAGVIPRSEWARGNPVPSLMDRAQPYWRITIHHDGMTPFTSTSRADAAARLEAIRAAHRSRDFGDIGYHYLIDPAGRVWEGRPLAWQGAHVRATNEGNLGICVLGNFQSQYPNPQQVSALDNLVASQMRLYRIPVSNVYTHRELGPTACPGNNLQSYCVTTRRSGALASA